MSDKLPNKAKTKANRKDAIQISFRVDDAAYQKLKTSADTLNISVTKFAKLKAENARIVTPKYSPETQIAILKQLNGTTNNLNQLAKRLNIHKDKMTKDELMYSVDEFKNLRSEVEKLWQLLN